MQRTEKRPAARRAPAGLAVANSSECNNAEGRLSARPKGAHPIGNFVKAFFARRFGHARIHIGVFVRFTRDGGFKIFRRIANG